MKPTRLYEAAILISFLWTNPCRLYAQDRAPDSRVPAQAATGESVAKAMIALFDPLPPGWVAEQNVMDPIWEPLGLKGVNYYAYGGLTTGNDFSARSDPDSSLYQAWFGVYVVAGGKAKFQSGDETQDCRAAAKLGEYDQRSWLEAMGDPNPVAVSQNPHFSSAMIDGSKRPLCSFDMQTHSDLGPGTTPLAKHIGMPPAEKWKDRLSLYHDLTLHVIVSWGYDQRRDLTMIVYSASSAFTEKLGRVRDNGPVLDRQLRQMMGQVRLADVAAARQ
jgi:hypothetical protein